MAETRYTMDEIDEMLADRIDALDCAAWGMGMSEEMDGKRNDRSGVYGAFYAAAYRVLKKEGFSEEIVAEAMKEFERHRTWPARVREPFIPF